LRFLGGLMQGAFMADHKLGRHKDL